MSTAAAWFVGLLATAAVCAAIAGRRLPVPTARAWWARAALWAVSAAVAGALAVALSVMLLAAVQTAGRLVQDPGGWLQQVYAAGFMYAFFAILMSLAIFVPLYLPLLLVWARFGPALQHWESTTRGVMQSSVVLAVPAAIAFALLGNSAVSGLLGLASAAVGLLVPRLLFPILRPGTFSASPATPGDALDLSAGSAPASAG